MEGRDGALNRDTLSHSIRTCFGQFPLQQNDGTNEPIRRCRRCELQLSQCRCLLIRVNVAVCDLFFGERAKNPSEGPDESNTMVAYSYEIYLVRGLALSKGEATDRKFRILALRQFRL